MSYAQKGNYDQEPEATFQPMFSLGMGFHSFQGDIMGNKTNPLSGNVGFRSGMRIHMKENIDLSFLFSNVILSEQASNDQKFKSTINSVGMHLDYTINSILKQSRVSPFLSIGLQSINYQTTLNEDKLDRASSFALPIGGGLILDVSERIKMDVGMHYTVSFADIDQSTEGNTDSYLITTFTLHYDLFTPSPEENGYYDDSYYADVNFKALDVADEDGDLVADIDDYCPKTPIGVKVDANGCPLDSDNDGIPNYIDLEKNTKRGAVVDEKGVQLTEEKYHSMYSDYEVASREYANFYNESEIKRENFKSTNEYLIAKANAFNKAYNDGEVYSNDLIQEHYKVQLGKYNDGVPANEINKYLSLEDLESIPQEDGFVVYAIGSFNSVEKALEEQFELEAKGFSETVIIVDNNGIVMPYIPNPEPVIIEEEIVTEEEIVVENPLDETVYRIQIGAYKVELSGEVFNGVDNVISFTGKDGLIRYMTGSFAEYKDAVDYMHQMRARGFNDAFIVTYKDGERISLNVAIKTERTVSKIEPIVTEAAVKPNIEFTVQVLVVKPNVEFTVQVLVAEESLSAENLTKMSKLGNIEKASEGQELYRYFAGTYSSLEDANIRLAEVKLAGHIDAFVFAELDGERITLEQAKELLK